MRTWLLLGAMLMLGTALADAGGWEWRELPRPRGLAEPILREDFDRGQPPGLVRRDERQPDTWILRTKDWPTPLLNAVGKPPDLTYDPQLKGVYDIYLGSRATDFPVSFGLRLSSEPDFTTITCPRGTETHHSDWEYCFRREVKLDGEKLVLRCLGPAVYLDYLKFVPITGGTARYRVATDHVVVASEQGKHFAFPGLARLQDGSFATVFRQGTAHIDPSGSVGFCRSTDGGRTWSARRTIVDDPQVDERDPGILQHSSGTLVVSYHGRGAQTIRSTDGGQTWDAPARAPVFSPHGPREAPDGSLYWCGIKTRMGINQVDIATSRDLGRTWPEAFTTALSLPYHQPWVRPFWDEPFALPSADGRWLCHYRVDQDGFVYQNAGPASADFPVPLRLGLWGCPPFLLRLQDGRVLALYGYRQPPWGIRGCVSRDNGQTWDVAQEFVLRADGGHTDLGYPVALEVEPGLVLAVYYFNHGGPECSIEGTYFRP